MVPVAAGLGYASSVIHIYGIGPYFGPVAQEFGWSRTEVTFGLTLATLVQAVGGVFIGLAVDRFGPRRFGLAGLLLLGGAFALLGQADGSLLQWYLLWGLIALVTLPVQASIWTSAVATLFHASRGLAFAVTLCGASIAAAAFPLMGTYAIARLGWRDAFPAQAAAWLLLVFPVIFLFFRGRQDHARRTPGEKADTRELPGVSLKEGMRSSAYHRLFVASLLFTFTIMAVVVHFTAILGDSGADKMTAAAIASLIGWFSLAGRLGTGFLPGRLSATLGGAGGVGGDAPRLQALMAAGLVRASAVVVTYIDVPAALKVLANTRSHAPQVPVVVRTQDDAHLDKLQDAGATEVVPEAIEGSLMLASHALALVGVPMRRVLRVVQDQRDARYNMLRGYFHGADDDTPNERDQERMSTVSLPPGAKALGSPLGDLALNAVGVRVVNLRRANGHQATAADDAVLQEGDTLVLSGHPTALALAEDKLLRG